MLRITGLNFKPLPAKIVSRGKKTQLHTNAKSLLARLYAVQFYYTFQPFNVAHDGMEWCLWDSG